jgi:ATP-dependent DNA helicase PIF1
MLTNDQQVAFENAMKRNHVLITGPGGTGKSFLIKYICEEFSKNNKKYALIAPTGVAAVNIGGITIHKFLQITPDTKNMQDYMNSKYKRNKVNWSTLDCIIIDEVSMIHPTLFLLFDAIARFQRRNETPFGGIQIIFIGDFFQLSPIPDKNSNNTKGYIFETELWKNMNITICLLDTIMRQSSEVFIRALNDIRIGKFSKVAKELIATCTNNDYIPDKRYVKLFSLNIDKNVANETELQKLDSKSQKYLSLDTGDSKYLNGCKGEKELLLKENCSVMLLCNLDVESGLCNGSTGRVLSFDESKMPIVLFNNGITLRMEPYVWNISDTNEYGKRKVIASRKQIPLAVAYSITAHKSQGLTLDHVEIDCNGVFTNGQLYVMLSRASSMEGLIIRNFDFKSIMVDHRVIKFYEDLKKQIKPMLE